MYISIVSSVRVRVRVRVNKIAFHLKKKKTLRVRSVNEIGLTLVD